MDLLVVNKILTAFLVLLICEQYTAQDGLFSDNYEADSQSLYHFIKVPSKKFKYSIHPDFAGADYDIDFHSVPKYSYPIFTSKSSAPKSVFTPNDQFVLYANYHAINNDKNIFFKPPTAYKKYGYQRKYRPFHPNFHTDLQTVKLPLSISEKENYEFITNPNPHDFQANFKLQDVPNLYSLEQDFLESASQKQIEKYFEDQQKEKEEQFEQKLLNDPNPAAKGIYQQYLKAKEDEKIEKEYVEQTKKDRQLGTGYAPVDTEQEDVITMSNTPGLRYYKTLKHDRSAYEFEVQL